MKLRACLYLAAAVLAPGACETVPDSAFSANQLKLIASLRDWMSANKVTAIRHAGPQGPDGGRTIRFDGPNYEYVYVGSSAAFGKSNEWPGVRDAAETDFLASLMSWMRYNSIALLQAVAMTKENQGWRFALDVQEPRLTSDEIDASLQYQYEDFEVSEIAAAEIRVCSG